MNITSICGNVVNVRKNDVSTDRVAYNFSIAVDEGYGENKKTTFFNCATFAKKGAQEKYYDDMIVKGARLPVSGTMGTGKPYTDKNGSTITPWVLKVDTIGVGINEAVVSGRLTEDAQVSEVGDRTIVKYTIAVNRRAKDAPADFIKCTQFAQSGGGLAKYASENLLKGVSLQVVGRQQTSSYTDKDGNKRRGQELIVRKSELFGNKKNTDDTAATMEEDPATTYAPVTGSAGVATPNVGDFTELQDDGDMDLPF